MITPGDERNNSYLNNAIDDLKNIWNTMIDVFTKMDLDEMVHLYSKKIDTEILKRSKKPVGLIEVVNLLSHTLQIRRFRLKLLCIIKIKTVNGCRFKL